MTLPQDYTATLNRIFEGIKLPSDPSNLYAPIRYILSLGGKRIRPALVLMACEACGGNKDDAIDAAKAIEVFHNFTLMHDDIMDDAPLRRGKATVHAKWDVNTGILSGDAMLIKSYQFLQGYTPDTQAELLDVFSRTALQVCEGQQDDVDFEMRSDVTVDEYLHMIAYKTAVLVGCALEMGVIIALSRKRNSDVAKTTKTRKALYDYGLNLGIAFQLMDDYLDAFGNPITFGKQVGGDILEHKKTYLYLKALENKTWSDRLEDRFRESDPSEKPDLKIAAVKQIFTDSGAADATRAAIRDYTDRALLSLEDAELSEESRGMFLTFAKELMGREQ